VTYDDLLELIHMLVLFRLWYRGLGYRIRLGVDQDDEVAPFRDLSRDASALRGVWWKGTSVLVLSFDILRSYAIRLLMHLSTGYLRFGARVLTCIGVLYHRSSTPRT
jgi:hypothetical protein